jgi:hypothetical protein
VTRERVNTGTYRAAEFGLNWSTLKWWGAQFGGSPMLGHYHETTGDAGSDSPDLILGRAFHCAALEPETFGDRFVALSIDEIARLAPSRGTKEGKAAFAEYVEQHPAASGMTSDEWKRICAQAAYPGRTLLTEDERDLVLAMRDAVHAHRGARTLLDRVVEREAVRRWTDEKTGTKCKGRLDCVLDNGDILDLKSARSIKPEWFRSDAWSRGNMHQGTFYRRGQLAHGISRAGFTLIAVEKHKRPRPLDVCVMPVSGFMMDDRCDPDIDELLALRRRCNESGEWPGAYPDPIEINEPPRWAQTDSGDGEMTMTVTED